MRAVRSGPFAHPGFVRLWLADGVSMVGTFASGLALQLLLIDTLAADQTALGVVRAAQWLPALLLGMLAGVLIDRVRRRAVMIAADAASALLFGTIAGPALAGVVVLAVASLVLTLSPFRDARMPEVGAAT